MTNEVKHSMEILRMIEDERTRVWCRRCAGYAAHKLEKLLFSQVQRQAEEEKDRTNAEEDWESGERV